MSPPANESLARRFLSSRGTVKRYVVGRNDQSKELIEKFQIDGLIDDFDQSTSCWSGVPILCSKVASSDAIVVNCSTSIAPLDVEKNLSRSGLRHIVAFGDLLRVAPQDIRQPWFVSQQREDMKQHILEWAELYAALDDKVSRETLLDVSRYRLTADPRYMRGYAVRLKDQYFESFLDSRQQVFVDAGGFDGDTTEEFCRRYPDYRRVLLFEPSAINMAVAQQRLGHMRDIEYFAIGLSDVEGTLRFNANAGPASAVCDDEGEAVPVTTLDHAVSEPVTFVKMDLEGWEVKALHGARGHIEREAPQLAIGVYHRASDFRDVARYVRSLNPSYRVRLRHYTQGWSETVMYFTTSAINR